MKTYGSVSWEHGEWAVRATPDVMMRLRRVFPRATMSRSSEIRLTHTEEVAQDLEWVMSRWPLNMAPAHERRLTQGAKAFRERAERVSAILAGNHRVDGLMDPARPARDYQLVAADLALTTKSLLLADDLGLGKSMSGILALRDSGYLPALIVCPTHLPRQWQGELAKTLPLLTVHIARKGTAYEWQHQLELGGHSPDVLIMNYHKLAGWADHLAGQVRTVIFDEAQELRREESDKYRAAAMVADQAELRIGLTATPVYNYAGEIHNIMAILAPGVLGTKEEFGREWAEGWNATKTKVREPRALGTYLRDQGVMLRRTRAEVGRELPEVVRVPHSVDTDEKVYEQLMAGTVDLAHVILDGKPKEAFTAAGELDWKVRRATGVAKAPYVAEFAKMVLESEQRIVLFGWHRDVYAIWLKQLQHHRPVLYTGSESPGQKDRAKERFLKDPNDLNSARVLIMSLRSGAGLDGLQEAASVAIFGELDWSPAMHNQCVGRLHRDGQTSSVVAYFLVSDTGSDPVIADVLNVKRSQSEPLNDPDKALFEQATDTRDHVRKLAESLVAKRSSRELEKAA